MTDADIETCGRWTGVPVPSPTQARASLNLQALAQLLGPSGTAVRDLDLVAIDTRAWARREPSGDTDHD